MAPPANPAEAEKLEEFLQSFWTKQVQIAEEETFDFRHPLLPLARIKKVMKSDPDVKMIGSDAPIIFAKACEIFIQEITSRAWIVAEQAKRRTLSRADIARALQRSDQFDFLIDIVPRELANEKGRSGPRRNADNDDIQPGEEDEHDEAGQASGNEVDQDSQYDHNIGYEKVEGLEVIQAMAYND